MALNLQQLIQAAQALSPKRLYQPEASPDWAMQRALVEQTNVELAAVAVAPEETVATATISGNVATVGPTTLFTSSGDNTVSQLYEVSCYAENQSLGMVGGLLGITVRWDWNGVARSQGFNTDLDNTSGELSSNFQVLNLSADVGTAVTWEYDVTTWTSGSTPIRIVFAVRPMV